MDPVTVPILGVLVAGGVIGGSQVAEDWNTKDGVPEKMRHWNPLWIFDYHGFREKERARRRDLTEVQARTQPSIGFFLSKNAPYYIHDVISAMDINGWTQGEPRYQNPFIQRGDVLMAIEEEDVTHADFDLIKDLLSGEDRSLLRCTFNRAGNESTFTWCFLDKGDGGSGAR
ncbi:hypothetical protein T484DRAFT_1776655 [Baffinella frigidus]|nr:hypothetical protein T484DRAFT_1776655 [Cryptophyta sp. CCMP2293]